MYSKFFKRLIDLCFALVLIILLSPFYLMIVILLYFANGGHPFFLQVRPGKNEKTFCLVKFKTMNDKRNEFGVLLPDNERLTSLGRFIRSVSIDELPQLINVLKGEMSFIGPRPLLVQYLPLYNVRQKKRHAVRPGITGWAQVNGRNKLNWEEKFELDVYYVEHLSFLLDLKIIFLTIRKVMLREGINASSAETMGAFKGNGTLRQ
ncbi:MAG: sugar transferase [Bacteroidetes bacterium]|nr:sugar transferase [Bacteroidota bacterium]